MNGLHRVIGHSAFLLLVMSLSSVSMSGCFNGSSSPAGESEGAQTGSTGGECSDAELQEMISDSVAYCEGEEPTAIPDSCFDFLQDGKLSLPHAPDPHDATTIGHVIIENQTIAELGGEPCHEVLPGRIYNCTTSYPTVALEECRRAFICGCCSQAINVGVVQQIVPSGKYLALDVRVPTACFGNPNLIGGVGYLDQITSYEGSSGGGSGGMNSAACEACLSDCQGYSGCCTGVGCICEDECTSTAPCGPGLTYCCGPQGDCFCWEDCPY